MYIVAVAVVVAAAAAAAVVLVVLVLVVLVLVVLVLVWAVKDHKVGRCEQGGCVRAPYSVGNTRLVVWSSPSPC